MEVESKKRKREEKTFELSKELKKLKVDVLFDEDWGCVVGTGRNITSKFKGC